MITTIFFDLDGTLLPMDQDAFLKAYLGLLAKKMAPLGYDPDKLIRTIWAGTKAMVKNDGSRTNEAAFWSLFESVYGAEARKDEPVFEQFYREDFKLAQQACGFDPQGARTVHTLQEMGLQTVLATNPLFPPIATQSRVRWAGLTPEDFAYITTYDNSRFCKPNLDYYREILGKLNLQAENCMMVGNDVGEDMVAGQLGMKVFLLTPCLINREGADISPYPHGGFAQLLDYIRSL